MASQAKRRREEGAEEYLVLKKFNTGKGLLLPSNKSGESADSAESHANGQFLSSRGTCGRFARDDSLSDSSSSFPTRSMNNCSPLASPNSVHSTSSFDNMSASALLESPKPNYSHSSSSHKFQDYNKSDDEDESEGGRLMGGASAFATGTAIATDDNNHDFGRTSFYSEGETEGSTANNTSSSGPLNNEEGSDFNTSAQYSSAAQKMMSAMGYQKGKGLGAAGTGRLEPIEASQQRGRRGLGHTVPKLKLATGLAWDSNNEKVSAEEFVQWVPSCPLTSPLTLSLLSEWMQVGPRKLVIEDETQYCDPDILHGMLQAKNVFDELGEREIQRARLRSNPFETIGKVFFQNRAALKMANLDSVTQMMFTKPVDEQGRLTVSENEVLYFADVCAAPGGFAEYAIWRRKHLSNGFPDVHGFGFTLRSNDFKLQDFYAAPREFFEPHYGEGGQSGDGDVFKPNNIGHFCTFVKTATLGRGVHFMMADGGFSVDGQENLQEILSKQLYLCQFTVALGIVREGGHFVCKLFDTFTPFTLGLIYLMYRCFKRIAIHKPNTSRPANSERYIICKWLKPGCECVFSYLFDVNEKLNSLRGSEEDVVELVPEHVMQQDEAFYQYMVNSNNTIGQQQISSLLKMQAYCEDTRQVEKRQGSLRTESLQLWGVPDLPRIAPVREQPARKVANIVAEQGIRPLNSTTVELTTPSCLSSHIHSVYNYRFVVTSVPAAQHNKDRAFYLGLGGRNVYRNDSLSSGTWERIQPSVELPPDTLLYAELVNEVRGMSNVPSAPGEEKADIRSQRRLTALHIIDGLTLNGFDISKMHLVDRNKHLRRFCLAVNKTSRPDLLPIRCKQHFRLEEIQAVLAPPLLSVRSVKNSGVQRVLYCKDPEDGGGSGGQPYHVLATGLLLVSTVREPWMMAFSRTNKRKYFFHTVMKNSTFEVPLESIADFSTSYNSSLLWPWLPGTVILGNDRSVGSDFLLEDSDSDDADAGPATSRAAGRRRGRDLLHLEHLVQFINTPPPPAPPQQQHQQH